MKSIRRLLSSLAVLTALTLIVGCGPASTPPAPTPTPPGGSTKPGTASGEHTHGAGPHGGAMGDWGGDKYHIEFTVEHPKQEATVYILGNNSKLADDKQVPGPIKAKDGQLSLSIKGPKSGEFHVVLKADPQSGDPEGKSSRFVGKDEKLGVEQEFEGTVEGDADGANYTGTFKEEPAKPKDK